MDEKISRIYTTDPPEHPGPDWTRFVCISDTHSHTSFKIPPGDILLHSGDLSTNGHIPSQLHLSIDWIKSLEHPIKILIAGNHDLLLDKAESFSEEATNTMLEYLYSQELKDCGIYYLQNESLTTICAGPGKRKWKLFGSPATPFYGGGAFQYASPTEAKVIYDQIPLDTEILLTHTPPYRLLDKTKKGKHAGCKTLLVRLSDLERLRLHTWGHIHEAHGAKVDETRKVAYINAALGSPNAHREAIVVDLKN